jgi:hypothetical protein
MEPYDRQFLDTLKRTLLATDLVPLSVAQRLYLIARVRADQTGNEFAKDELVQVLKAELPHDE